MANKQVTHAISSQYPFLATARPDVDWRHVNPILLRQLNALGRYLKKVIVIFSGYRSDAYSQKVGGFAGDPHTRHIAVDATIGGKPIGNVVSRKLFDQFGLRTGNQPNFYHGKPDPSHVDLVGTVNEKAGSASSETADATATTTTGGSAAAVQMPDFSGALPVGQAQAGPPELLPAGTVQAGGLSPRVYGDLWRSIATQPGASPDTLDYAKLLGV